MAAKLNTGYRRINREIPLPSGEVGKFPGFGYGDDFFYVEKDGKEYLMEEVKSYRGGFVDSIRESVKIDILRRLNHPNLLSAVDFFYAESYDSFASDDRNNKNLYYVYDPIFPVTSNFLASANREELINGVVSALNFLISENRFLMPDYMAGDPNRNAIKLWTDGERLIIVSVERFYRRDPDTNTTEKTQFEKLTQAFSKLFGDNNFTLDIEVPIEGTVNAPVPPSVTNTHLLPVAEEFIMNENMPEERDFYYEEHNDEEDKPFDEILQDIRTRSMAIVIRALNIASNEEEMLEVAKASFFMVANAFYGFELGESERGTELYINSDYWATKIQEELEGVLFFDLSKSAMSRPSAIMSERRPSESVMRRVNFSEPSTKIIPDPAEGRVSPSSRVSPPRVSPPRVSPELVEEIEEPDPFTKLLDLDNNMLQIYLSNSDLTERDLEKLFLQKISKSQINQNLVFKVTALELPFFAGVFQVKGELWQRTFGGDLLSDVISQLSIEELRTAFTGLAASILTTERTLGVGFRVSLDNILYSDGSLYIDDARTVIASPRISEIVTLSNEIIRVAPGSAAAKFAASVLKVSNGLDRRGALENFLYSVISNNI